VSPWAEGTLRRIAREPIGDKAVMIKALQDASNNGAQRDLAFELLARLGDVEFLTTKEPNDPAVAFALGFTADKRFLPGLKTVAATAGPAQLAALRSLGQLKGQDELLSLAGTWRAFDDQAREAYARAVALQATEAVLPLLGELSTDANWRVRFRAAIGLGATRSPKAGPYILKLLDDRETAVFKVALWWCTDTFILRPEEYFPKLIARLTPEEQPEIVRADLHALLVMWAPGLGQPLSDGEDPAKRIDYAKLPVWKDPALAAALGKLAGHPDPRLAIDALVLNMKMGQAPKTEDVLAKLKAFKVEDQRWFCQRMREEQTPAAAPLMAGLWSVNDRLVRTFILQYSQRTPTPETFEIAFKAYNELPPADDLHSTAVLAMAAHVKKLDDTARRAIPVMLELYEKGSPEVRQFLDMALSRAAGRPEVERLSAAPADVASRLAEWKQWWAEQNK
jgi:hypothetical protein